MFQIFQPSVHLVFYLVLLGFEYDYRVSILGCGELYRVLNWVSIRAPLRFNGRPDTFLRTFSISIRWRRTVSIRHGVHKATLLVLFFLLPLDRRHNDSHFSSRKHTKKRTVRSIKRHTFFFLSRGQSKKEKRKRKRKGTNADRSEIVFRIRGVSSAPFPTCVANR